MRKFKTRPPLTFAFRLFLVVTGTLLLMAAFAPCANADLLRFYDFEGTPPPPPPPPGQDYGVNLESHVPAVETGATTALFLDNGVDPNVPYLALRTSVESPGLSANLPPGAAQNNTALGFHRVGATGALGVQIPFAPLPAPFTYNITSVSFAYSAQGNGYSTVALQISSDGGATFTTIAGTSRALPPNSTNGTAINITLAPGTTENITNLELRVLFTGGTSNGTDLQFVIDNFQINGTVPEPATVAGGLLGVLGLCWFQRRRLIGALRLRRTSG